MEHKNHFSDAKTQTPRAGHVHHPTLFLVAKINIGKYLWRLIASFWLNLTLRHFQTHAEMILFLLKTPSSLNAAEGRIVRRKWFGETAMASFRLKLKVNTLVLSRAVISKPKNINFIVTFLWSRLLLLLISLAYAVSALDLSGMQLFALCNNLQNETRINQYFTCRVWADCKATWKMRPSLICLCYLKGHYVVL